MVAALDVAGSVIVAVMPVGLTEFVPNWKSYIPATPNGLTKARIVAVVVVSADAGSVWTAGLTAMKYLAIATALGKSWGAMEIALTVALYWSKSGTVQTAELDVGAVPSSV